MHEADHQDQAAGAPPGADVPRASQVDESAGIEPWKWAIILQIRSDRDEYWRRIEQENR